MASGVSSTIKSTPVAASIARMLRPSLPIIWPFISSDSKLNTVTVFSIATSAAVRWIDCIIILRASLFAFCFASSIISCCKTRACVCASFFKLSINCCLASSALKLAIFSNLRICSSWCFSNSVRFTLIKSISRFNFSLIASLSFTCLSKAASFWLVLISFCFILFSASPIFLFFSNKSRS